MPAEAKLLFRPEALRPKLAGFSLPPPALAARPKLTHWAALLANKQTDAMKESELLGDYLRDLFVDLLGYLGPAGGSPTYTLKREALIQIDGKFADAALGRFSTAREAPGFVAAVEILFIAFCEDRGLLPPESIAHAFRHADPYNPRPVWDNFTSIRPLVSSTR